MTQAAQGAALSVRQAVDLGHALVSRVAANAGADVLFIKGPISNLHNVRPKRGSTDVDVLVRPRSLALLVDSLGLIGWHERPMFGGARVLALHSVTLINDEWPCDIDLHDRFPGLFADHEEVFEVLWQRRSEARIAAQFVPCTDPIASALIAGVHALRDPGSRRNVDELAYLQQRLTNDFSPAERDGLFELARELRAQETLAPLLRSIGLTPLADLQPVERRQWELRTSDDPLAAGWVAELQQAGPRGKLRIASSLLFPTHQQMNARYEARPSSAIQWAWAYFRRLLRALRSVPRALRTRKRMTRASSSK